MCNEFLLARAGTNNSRDFTMSMILPVASKTVLIGRSEYRLLLDGGVHLINLGLAKKEEETVLATTSKVQHNVIL